MTNEPLADPVLEAAEKLVEAWRAKYRNPSTTGFRKNAPLYEEIRDLNAALANRRAAAIPEKEQGK